MALIDASLTGVFLLLFFNALLVTFMRTNVVAASSGLRFEHTDVFLCGELRGKLYISDETAFVHFQEVGENAHNTHNLCLHAHFMLSQPATLQKLFSQPSKMKGRVFPSLPGHRFVISSDDFLGLCEKSHSQDCWTAFAI